MHPIRFKDELKSDSRLHGLLPHRWVARLRWGCIATYIVMAGTTVIMALPFVFRDVIDWSRMNNTLLLGTITLLTGVFVHACLAGSVRHTLIFFAIAGPLSLISELTGVWFGFPFGSTYHYHPEITPQLFGSVPAFIPCAWIVIAYGPLVLSRHLTIHKQGAVPRVHKILFCSTALVSADLFLDPLATSVQAWTWHGDGIYFGIPALNFAGWFIVGLMIYTPYFYLCDRPRRMHDYRKVFYDFCYVTSCCVLILLSMIAVWLRIGSVIPIMATLVTFAPIVILWYVRTVPGCGLGSRLRRAF